MSETWRPPVMGKSLLCLILDRSGSMSGKESDVIGGVNAFIAEQKKIPDEAVLSMVRFDTEYEEFRRAQNLKEVQPIGPADYQPRGGTALLDAVGRSLVALDEAWKLHQPARGIVVIVTDGEENSSREWSKERIKAEIEARERSGKWSFVYLGASVNAFTEAGAMGIRVVNTGHYSNTSAGTQAVYAAAAASVGLMRATGTADANLGGHIPDADESGQAKVAWTPPAPTATTGEVWQPPV